MTRARPRGVARRAALVAASALLGLAPLHTTLALAAGRTSTTLEGRVASNAAQPSLGAPLGHELGVLWRAIVTGNPAIARALFFPRAAYVRMKSGLLANPGEDFDQRLMAFFTLDLAAYHRVVTAGGPPTFVGVRVDAADAAWIAPHACENLIGYWHLPGARLVYRQGRRVRSVAVDSLISWRGAWYVVHLGPNPRPHNVGTVDDPRSGPGVAGPPGGC